MVEHPDGDRQGRAATSDGSGSVSVLHVDPDPSVLEAVATHLGQVEADVEVSTTTEGSEAYRRARSGAVDCLVVEADLPGIEWDWLVQAVDAPVVVYTGADPEAIDDVVLERSDTLVRKREVASSREFLAEKVLGSRRESGDATAGAEAAARLEAALGADAGVFVLGSDGEVRYASASFETVFGTEDATVSVPETPDLHARLAALLDNDPERMEAVLPQVAGDERRQGRMVQVPGAGDGRAFLYYSYPLGADAAGARIELFQPIEDLLEATERLGLLESLVANAQDGLFVLDADARLVYCNESYASLFGFEVDDLLGTHVSRVMAPGELQRGQGILQEAWEAGEDSVSMELTHETAGGRTIHTAATLTIRREDGQYAGLMGVIRDVTDRRTRRKRLEEYRTLVETAGDPMLVLDEDHRVHVLNPAMAAVFGKSRPELRGQDVRTLLPADTVEALDDAATRIRGGGEADWRTFETWIPSGEDERLHEVTVGTIDRQEGPFGGLVATFRDVTRRHRRKEELDLLKQVFARVLRHNIRNKASVIDSYATVLADDLEGRHAEMVEAIRAAAGDLTAASEQVGTMDWLMERDLAVVEHDLRAVLERSAEAAGPATERDVTIDVAVPEGLSARAIHDVELAFENLLENALEHGGEEVTRVAVEARRDGDEAVVVVSDDGPGMPEEEIAVLERQAETAFAHGSGLGLWVIDRIVAESGGEVDFAVEDGTVVTVRLPLSDRGE